MTTTRRWDWEWLAFMALGFLAGFFAGLALRDVQCRRDHQQQDAQLDTCIAALCRLTERP